MVEVITDEKMRNFVHSKVSNEFGLSVEQVADKCKSYGRFSSWLNGNITLIVEVLNKVKSNGVSPAFFASYEKTEGYNSSWGWLNHTTPQGTYLNDSDSVSKWIVTQSKNTTDKPAWIDFANYNDFVPNDVKVSGDLDFQNMTSGSIGKVVIAGTAAATWEVYYPNGLKAEYNGVQNYGAPINAMMDIIIEWGGTLTGGETNPENPDIKTEVIGIVENGRQDLKDGFSIDTSGLSENLIDGLKQIYNPPLSFFSKDVYNNTYFKLTKTFSNLMKINPNIGLQELMSEIINESLKNISVTLDIDGVFDRMISEINSIVGGTTPEPNNDMFFPVNIQEQGINFWVPPEQPNMDYGGERSGRLHWAYDIGTLGNANVSCHAVRSGEVISVNADNLGTVVIKHDSDTYYTQYMHLLLGAFTVQTGDKVVAGQKIGIVGGTGGYDIHLHFAVSKNGTFATEIDTINPRPYLQITGNNTTSLPNP